MWRNNFLWNYVYKELITYPVYANLFYWWNFGVLSFVCLVMQVLTGIFLAMYYNATSETAFLSVEHIMRDINYGWLIRYVHVNGVCFLFLCVYLHILRNISYNPVTLLQLLYFLTFIINLSILLSLIYRLGEQFVFYAGLPIGLVFALFLLLYYIYSKNSSILFLIINILNITLLILWVNNAAQMQLRVNIQLLTLFESFWVFLPMLLFLLLAISISLLKIYSVYAYKFLLFTYTITALIFYIADYSLVYFSSAYFVFLFCFNLFMITKTFFYDTEIRSQINRDTLKWIALLYALTFLIFLINELYSIPLLNKILQPYYLRENINAIFSSLRAEKIEIFIDILSSNTIKSLNEFIAYYNLLPEFELEIISIELYPNILNKNDQFTGLPTTLMTVVDKASTTKTVSKVITTEIPTASEIAVRSYYYRINTSVTVWTNHSHTPFQSSTLFNNFTRRASAAYFTRNSSHTAHLRYNRVGCRPFTTWAHPNTSTALTLWRVGSVRHTSPFTESNRSYAVTTPHVPKDTYYAFFDDLQNYTYWKYKLDELGTDNIKIAWWYCNLKGFDGIGKHPVVIIRGETHSLLFVLTSAKKSFFSESTVNWNAGEGTSFKTTKDRKGKLFVDSKQFTSKSICPNRVEKGPQYLAGKLLLVDNDLLPYITKSFYKFDANYADSLLKQEGGAS